MEIREVAPPEFEERAFIELLKDSVDSGASVGFLAPLPAQEGGDYWRGVRSELAEGRVLFGAFVEGKLVGSAQLAPVARPNGRHRAEVQKLMVLRRYRGRGIAKALMALSSARRRSSGAGCSCSIRCRRSRPRSSTSALATCAPASYRTMRRSRAAALIRP